MKMKSGRRLGVRASEGFSRAVANDRGVALMIVLWVMTLLMIIVSEFAYTMKVESAAVRNFKDEAEAYYLASAGINMGLAEISESYDLVCLDKDGSLVFKKKENGVLRDIEAKREEYLGGGKVFYTVSDERGKVNINTATRETISEVLRIAGIEVADRDIIADSILDWRDADQEHHMNGAETDYYSSLPRPYAAKDGPLDTVEELLLVRGMTTEVFYGAGMAPPELDSSASASGSDYKGVSRYLTVKGDGKININTADEKVLEAVLGRGKTQEVLLRRSTEGFFEMPAYGGAVSSDTFLIRSIGEVRGVRVGIRAVAERKLGAANAVVSYWKEEGITPD
ncbi:MAG: general secretion pathway protein GspK [Deltaproteobacteria bacterium]|nr:general secretion pathway protein GspK [Deltaproteobacteria bacterium]